jgi:hypothetical protein
MKYVKFAVMGVLLASLSGCGLYHFVFHDGDDHPRHVFNKDRK